MPRADQPFSVRFERETLESLQREAQKRRWGTSALVRYICQEWLTWAKRQEKPKRDRHAVD